MPYPMVTYAWENDFPQEHIQVSVQRALQLFYAARQGHFELIRILL